MPGQVRLAYLKRQCTRRMFDWCRAIAIRLPHLRCRASRAGATEARLTRDAFDFNVSPMPERIHIGVTREIFGP
jgi:hypothetical protein